MTHQLVVPKRLVDTFRLSHLPQHVPAEPNTANSERVGRVHHPTRVLAPIGTRCRGGTNEITEFQLFTEIIGTKGIGSEWVGSVGYKCRTRRKEVILLIYTT
jgi:hypothetical protein